MTTKIASFVMLILFAGTVGVVAYLMLGGEIGRTPDETATSAEEVAMEPNPTSTDTATPVPNDTSTPVKRATSAPTALATNTPTPSKTTTPTPRPSKTPPWTPVPTDTPVSATHTSTPKPTYTPKPPTATRTPGPTATPITPTKTPDPSPTPTPISPTATPKPAAGAVVDAPGGLVTMRSGPGDEYDKIHDLPDGTLLEVVRTVHNKADWIKVAANPDTEERIEGYVNIASGLIKINVNVGTVPTIYEYGPRLLEPIRFASYAAEDNITFKWRDYVSLEEDQYYSVILVRDDLSDEEACFHWQAKGTAVSFTPEDYDCTDGAYHWGVSIATDLSGGEKSHWRSDSEFNERNPLGLGMPHPDTPTGDEQDPGELPPDT